MSEADNELSFEAKAIGCMVLIGFFILFFFHWANWSFAGGLLVSIALLVTVINTRDNVESHFEWAVECPVKAMFFAALLLLFAAILLDRPITGAPEVTAGFSDIIQQNDTAKKQGEAVLWGFLFSSYLTKTAGIWSAIWGATLVLTVFLSRAVRVLEFFVQTIRKKLGIKISNGVATSTRCQAPEAQNSKAHVSTISENMKTDAGITRHATVEKPMDTSQQVRHNKGSNGIASPVWDISQERAFMENLMNQRFNFFMVFVGLVTNAATNAKTDGSFLFILWGGFVATLLLWWPVRRAHAKVQVILTAIEKSDAGHPLVQADAGFGKKWSARRALGVIIPFVAVATFFILAVLASVGIVSAPKSETEAEKRIAAMEGRIKNIEHRVAERANVANTNTATKASPR